MSNLKNCLKISLSILTLSTACLSTEFAEAQSASRYCVSGLSNQPPDNYIVLRNAPNRKSTWSNTITFKNGDSVEVIGAEGDYYRVRAQNGEIGWSAKAYLFPCGQPAPTQQNAQQNGIPQVLLGDYLSLPENSSPVCKIKDTDAIETLERFMKVEPKLYSRYEMGCTPARITNNHPYYTFKMQCSGEGENWNEDHHWVLSKILDRNVLMVTTARTIKGSLILNSTVFEKCTP